MYVHNRVFQPSNLYYNINLQMVKNRLNKEQMNFKDFGSIIIIKKQEYMMTLNNLGSIEIFYDKYDKNLFDTQVQKMEDILREQISDFKLLVQ